MSDWREGDLVEATNGETVIRGRLRDGGPKNGGRPLLTLTLVIESDILHLEANGYTVTLIERAPEPLPTERGVYVSTRTDYGFNLSPYYLDGRGIWHELDSGAVIVVTHSDVAEFAPLKRLDVTS